MAVDDIVFHNCAEVERIPGTCTFEHGSCGYKEYIFNDEYNWILNQGPTPSYYTGPAADHTYGGCYLPFINYNLVISILLILNFARLFISEVRILFVIPR